MTDDDQPESQLPDELPARPIFRPEWRLAVEGATGRFHVDARSEAHAVSLGEMLKHSRWSVEWRPVGEWQRLGPTRRTIVSVVTIDQDGQAQD